MVDSDDFLANENTCTDVTSLLRVDWLNDSSQSFCYNLASKCDTENSNLFVMCVDMLHKPKEKWYP